MMPKRLEMENFLSHSYSEVHFDFSSALIVGEHEDDQFKSNGSGKSAIFQAIAWVLFGKSRCKYAQNIVKDGRPSCKVTLEFTHEDKTYKIIRSRNAKYASQNSLEFFEILDDGTEEIVPADTNTELDKKIRDVISSNYETFINSAYFKQGDVSGFLNGKTSDRQKIVSSILNLERWDKYKTIADKRYKEVDKELSLLKYKFLELDNVEEQIKEQKEALSKSKEEQKNLIDSEKLISAEIKSINKRIDTLRSKKGSLDNYQTNKSEYNYLCKKVEDLELSKKEKEKLIESSLGDISKNNQAIEYAESKIVELKPNLELKDKFKIDDFESKLMKGKVKFDLLTSQIETLELKDECDACGTIWSDRHKKHSEIDKKKEELSELKAKIEKAEAILKQKKEKYQEICDIELEIEKYSNRVSTYKNNNNLHSLRIESAKSELSLVDNSLKEAIDKKDSLKDILDSTKEVQSITDLEVLIEEENSKSNELEDIRKTKEEVLYRIGALTHKLEDLNKDLSKKKILSEDIEKLNREAAVYSNLVRSFGRNGIQAIIVDNVMEELSKVTNEQLNEFTSVPTYVDFITQKKDAKGSWKETLDIEIRTPSGIREFDGLSGGEAFRVAFAIRLALSNIQARRMGGETQILMLDEVSTSLDKHGLEAFISIIRRLEKEVKVMVITHDDKLKEEFDHIIMVKKSGNDSSIIQS